MISDFRVDWTNQIVIATSGSDASAEITSGPPLPANMTNRAGNSGSWWMMVVSGTPAYINVGAAATSANVLLPIGVTWPMYFAPGEVLHALASTGSGQVGLVRCYIVA